MKEWIIIIKICLFILFYIAIFLSLFKPINLEKGVIILQSREYIKQQENLELLKLIEQNKKNKNFLDGQYENIHFR